VPRRRRTLNGLIVALLLLLVTAVAPVVYGASSSNQIVSAVNESDLVQLSGSTHPLALPKYDQGLVADGLRMEHMFVVLRRSPEQEQSLQQLAAALQNPHSASYHKWLVRITRPSGQSGSQEWNDDRCLGHRRTGG
jgi:hypothetical protein